MKGKLCIIEELYNCTPPRPALPTGLPPARPPPTFPRPTFQPRPTVSPGQLPTFQPYPPTFPSQLPVPSLPPLTFPSLPPMTFPPLPPLGPSQPLPPTEFPPVIPTQPLPPVSFPSFPPFNFPMPSRPPLTPTQIPGSPPRFQGKGSLLLRGGNYRRVQSKGFNPELIDYVLEAVCKRIRTVLANKICPTGILTGKMCRVEVEVPPMYVTPFSVETDVQPSQPSCPSGFSVLDRLTCVLTELKNVVYVCPEGTQDIGDRCVTYAPAVHTCPPEFSLENEQTCVQTVHAAPITEFSVTFSCVGKDCAGQ